MINISVVPEPDIAPPPLRGHLTPQVKPMINTVFGLGIILFYHLHDI